MQIELVISKAGKAIFQFEGPSEIGVGHLLTEAMRVFNEQHPTVSVFDPDVTVKFDTATAADAKPNPAL